MMQPKNMTNGEEEETMSRRSRDDSRKSPSVSRTQRASESDVEARSRDSRGAVLILSNESIHSSRWTASGTARFADCNLR